MKLKATCSLEAKLWQTQTAYWKAETFLCQHCFANKSPSSQSHSFSSSHVWMWEVDHKEGWGVKNWCFPTVVLEKTNQSIKRKSILNINWKDYCWSSNVLTTWCKELTRWKRPWYWERLKAGGEGVTEDEIVGWHHWLNGSEFEHTRGHSEGQGLSDWTRTTTVCSVVWWMRIEFM